MFTIFVSINGGWTHVHHLCAYVLIESWFPFSMDIMLVLSEVVTRLKLTTLRRDLLDLSTY